MVEVKVILLMLHIIVYYAHISERFGLREMNFILASFTKPAHVEFNLL